MLFRYVIIGHIDFCEREEFSKLSMVSFDWVMQQLKTFAKEQEKVSTVVRQEIVM